MTHLETKTPKPSLAAPSWTWPARHPVLAIILASLLAVVLNCHPIIFCGRSYVSPANAGIVVYSWAPGFPGVKLSPQVTGHGSDTAAMPLWGVPAGFIESRTLLQSGELPLWDRYGHAGTPFIGQAISMLGDPLQWIVILGHGSAWAWDIKFLAAKFLFCFGFGLLILRLLGSRPLSLLFAALAAYCGAFIYINNHPVFFVFCYIPWILFAALAWLDLQSKRFFRWGLLWLLANFACFNAGHVEVAVVFIGSLNLVALVYCLLACRRVAEFATVVGRMTIGTLLFIGLTAPVWISFLVAVEGAYSTHSEIQVGQISPTLLPCLFDDLLYRLLVPDDSVPAVGPGSSLLVLAGCLLSILRWRQLQQDKLFWINCSFIGLWGGCVYGWIPAFVLAHIPLLNRDGHTYTDFSYLLVVHLTLQSAYGFKALAQEVNFRRAVADCFWMVLLFAGMLLAYLALPYHASVSPRPIPWDYFVCAGVGAIGAPLLFAYWNRRGRRVPVAGWAAIILLGFAPQFRFGVYAGGNKDLLLLVASRAKLDASSAALDKIKTDDAGAFRVAGLQYNLYGDYAAVYGLEDIRSCAPLTSGDYIDLVRDFPGIDFSFAWIIEIKDPIAAQPLLNLLNVKYLLGRTNLAFPPGIDFRITDRSDFGVAENLDVWPRAFFTDQVIPIASTAEFIRHLVGHGQRPFAALTPQAIATQPGLSQLPATPDAVVVAATHYQLLPNATAFKIHAPAAGVVCLTESQARDFTATANGEPKAVLTVNRAFKGLYLDRPGDYDIQFTYRPRYWRLACTLFWLALAGVAALAAARLGRAKFNRAAELPPDPELPA